MQNPIEGQNPFNNAVMRESIKICGEVAIKLRSGETVDPLLLNLFEKSIKNLDDIRKDIYIDD